MKFGVREICDVTFKAAAANQKIGNLTFAKYQPIFKIDSATTSEMSQESTSVYAQGGQGYNRLISWEGEKTMTFTVTDALMSPMGMAVLSGAGLFTASDTEMIHVHTTYDAKITKTSDNKYQATIEYSDLADELGITDSSAIPICKDIPIYATILDSSGAGVKWLKEGAIAAASGTNAQEGSTSVFPNETIILKPAADSTKEGAAVVTLGDSIDGATLADFVGWTAELDFYVVLASGVTQITIGPNDFGGYFYVEADTLFRREDDGKDMAATLTFPRVKVQSGFTFTMAASGDPSTFDFTMDAFPGYTLFDRTNKVCVTMDIVGTDNFTTEENPHDESDPDTHVVQG